MELNVLGRYRISIDTPIGWDSEKPGERGYLQAVAKRRKAIVAQADAFVHSLVSARPPDSVIETCGGIGLFTTILRARWPGIRRHLIVEQDSFCYKHLETFTKDWREVELRCADATVPGWEWAGKWFPEGIVCDFGSFTAAHFAKQTPFYSLVQRMLARDPAWLIITDSSPSKLHLHLETYSKALGVTVRTAEDYLAGVDAWWRHTARYGVAYSYRHHGALMYRLEPR